MKEQVNEYAENINNFIKRWKWGKDEKCVKKMRKAEKMRVFSKSSCQLCFILHGN